MRNLLAVVTTAFMAASTALFSLPVAAAPAAGAIAGASSGVAADAREAGTPVQEAGFRHRRHRGLHFNFGYGIPRVYGYSYRPYRYYDDYPYYYTPRYSHRIRKHRHRHHRLYRHW